MLSDVFILTGSVKAEVKGRDAYVGLNFFKLVRNLEVKELFVDGERAAALIEYEFVSPK